LTQISKVFILECFSGWKFWTATRGTAQRRKAATVWSAAILGWELKKNRKSLLHPTSQSLDINYYFSLSLKTSKTKWPEYEVEMCGDGFRV